MSDSMRFDRTEFESSLIRETRAFNQKPTIYRIVGASRVNWRTRKNERVREIDSRRLIARSKIKGPVQVSLSLDFHPTDLFLFL